MQWLMQVCKDAGVELHVVPLTDEYWDRVVAHSIAEIKTGRTPNPDILCNSRCVMHAKLIGGNVYCKLEMYSTSQCVYLVMRGLIETLSRITVQRRAKHQCAHMCFCLLYHLGLAMIGPSWQCSPGFQLWNVFAHETEAILVWFCAGSNLVHFLNI